jgi:hypothetical protein
MTDALWVFRIPYVSSTSRRVALMPKLFAVVPSLVGVGLLVASLACAAQGAQTALVAAPDAGGAPQVRTYSGNIGALRDFFAYPVGFTGGVRVALGDLTGDGVVDTATGAGAGGGPHVKVFSGVDGSLARDFMAFDAAFSGGVYVGAGDVNGDGRIDLVVSTGSAAGRVRVFDGRNNAIIRDFTPYGAAFTGGVRVATGDVNGDGTADIVVASGSSSATAVKVFDGAGGAEIRSFLPYDTGFSGGVYVAAGDVTGDGRDDVITGPGAGGSPNVRVFDGITSAQVRSFVAYDAAFTGGVRVAAGDVNGDGIAEVMTGAGPGGAPQVKVFGALGAPPQSFNAFEPSFTGGVFVGGASTTDRVFRDGFE